MIKKIEGIIISEKSYRETSKILNILTKDHGLVGVIAKGSKQIKSPLRSVTLKLTYGNFYMVYKEDKLSNLTSVDVINPYKNIYKNIDMISYASFILELAREVLKHTNDTVVYDLLISSLNKINEGYDPLVITNILELKYLDYLGVLPNLDSCSICGSKNEIVSISSSSGGYICNNCITNKDRRVDDKTMKLLRMLYYVDINKIEKLEIKDKYKNEINTFLSEYYDRYTGIYLKSKSFITSLNKLVK